MPSVVFLRAVNVGKANRCQPALIAKQLAKFGVVNIGAVGTFVVRENVSESVLRAAIAKKLPFKCEIMICPARDVIRLASKDPFAGQPSGPDITRFVSVLARPLRAGIRSDLHQTSKIKPQTSQLPSLPLGLPSNDDWLLKIIAIQDRFVLGLYRRQMKAISYLGKIEKLLGVPATTRNWNTVEKIVTILDRIHRIEWINGRARGNRLVGNESGDDGLQADQRAGGRPDDHVETFPLGECCHELNQL